MNVSTYLEGFLTVYGWLIYETLYQLFSMTWLVFLPFLMLLFNFYRDIQVDNSYSGFGHFKSNIFGFLFMLFILFFCVVPLDTIKVKNTKINTVCTQGQALSSINSGKAGDYGFDGGEKGKVPIIPSLVMRIGQGTNNVIFRNIPCVKKVANLTMALKAANFRENDGVLNEGNAFIKQCVRPAQERIDQIEMAISDKFVDRLAKALSDRRGHDWSAGMQRRYMGSDLMLMMMDAGEGGVYQGALSTAATHSSQRSIVRKILATDGKPYKLSSSSPVEGVTSNNPDNSDYQKATNTGTVLCSAWWKEIRYDMAASAAAQITNILGATDEAASKDIASSSEMSPNKRLRRSDCRRLSSGSGLKGICDEVIKYYGSSADSVDKVIFGASQNTFANAALNSGESTVLNVAAGAGIGGAIAGMFLPLGNNILSNITESAVSWYGEMYMYRIIAKFLQPMLLMGIFAFWIFYMIVSGYRGETVFRGLVLIYVITLLPGIWAIADHIDSHLYASMFPGKDISEISSEASGLIERMVLDASSTAFYIIFPFILFFMVSEAGGPSANRAVQSSDAESRGLGRTAGGLGGNIAGRSSSNLGRNRNLGNRSNRQPRK